MADIVVCGDLEGEIEKSGDLSKLEALGSIEIFNELCSQAATQKLLDRLQIKSSYLRNIGLPNGDLNRERLPIDVACRSPAPAARAPANVDRTHTGAANINDLLTISRLVDNQLTC